MLTRITSMLVLVCVLLAQSGQCTNRGCPSPCSCTKFMGLYTVLCNVTGITEVPKGIPTNTQVLNLGQNPINNISRTDLQGLVNLEELDLQGIGLNDQSVEEGALDLPKLQTIDLTMNAYTTVPRFLPKNVTRLYLLYNKITTVTIFSFQLYSKLQYVDISFNGLKRFELGSLQYLTDLNTLYIQFNKLTDDSFPDDLFMKNTNLQLLGLRFNNLTRVLEHLPTSIQYFDYVGNQIKTLPAYAFQKFPNLQSMEFWQGQVTTIEDNAFYGLEKVTILDFMQDQISSTLTKDTFNGLTGLQTLYMDLNNISRIEPGAFRSFGAITSLWFSSNKLSTLDPEVLDENVLRKLNEVYIDDNPWYCDCHLRWLREKTDNATYVIQDPHLITCAGPSKVKGKAWDVLKPSDFVCP